MSIETNGVGHVQLAGNEKSVSIKIEKNTSDNKSQTVKVNAEKIKSQSLKAKPMVESRQSVASLVNEKKGSSGLKLDIKV